MRIFSVFSWLIISLLFLTTSSRAEETADLAIKESEQRLEKLERHIEALDRRLEASEQENKRLRAEKPAIVPTSSQPDITALDQKVKELEQRVAVGEEVEAEIAKKAPKFESGSTGLRFSSPDGAHVLNLRGSVQTDGKFFMDDRNTDKKPPEGSNLTNKFDLKQARLRFEGRLFNYYDFKIMPDFGGSSVRLNDAYIDAHYFSFASLNVGKQKQPIILERLQGDNDSTFLERAYPTYLARNRDDAAVLFTASFTDSLPYSLFKPVATLPLAIFFQLGTPFPEVQERGYASALVLTGIIFLISIVSRILSKKFSKRIIK